MQKTTRQFSWPREATLASAFAVALGAGCRPAAEDEPASFDAAFAPSPSDPDAGPAPDVRPSPQDADVAPPDAGTPDMWVPRGDCPYIEDGECDEPLLCEPGTDVADCRASGPPAAWLCSESAWSDGTCDCGCAVADVDCPSGNDPSDCGFSWCSPPEEIDPDDARRCTEVNPEPACVVDGDCGAGFVCNDGECVRGEAPACPVDASEENDVAGEAARLVVPGRLNVNFCDDAEDWYGVSLETGMVYRFETSALGDGGTLTLEIYGQGARDRLVFADADGRGGQIIEDFAPDFTGRHYLRVTADDGRFGPGRTYAIVTGASEAIPCSPGEARCAAAGDGVEICDDAGSWFDAYPCVAGTVCTEGGIAGPVCALPAGTRVVSSRLNYQPRGVNDDWDDWGDTFVSPAGALLALSYSAATGEFIDETVTDADGSFTIRVPDPSVEGDAVVFVAVILDDAGDPVFGVAEPDVGDGENDTDLSAEAQANARYHSTWIESALLDDVPEDFYLPVESSGWMRLFDYGRYVHHSMTDLVGEPGLSLVIWLRYGTSWTCGACFAPFVASVADAGFASQIWMPGLDADEAYWSDAVTAHELGHWLMGSFSGPVGEGGPHMVGVPTLPGMAWSEGFATWTSSVVRGSGVYFDKHNGSFFWFDLTTRGDSSGERLIPPDPAGDVYQWMDENEVAAELWAMTGLTLDDPEAEPSLQNGYRPYLRALTSPQMLGPTFGWGYTRHTWDLDATMWPVNVEDTGEPAPCYADYLDALRCADAISAEDMHDALNGFPYDPFRPLCP